MSLRMESFRTTIVYLTHMNLIHQLSIFDNTISEMTSQTYPCLFCICPLHHHLISSINKFYDTMKTIKTDESHSYRIPNLTFLKEFLEIQLSSSQELLIKTRARIKENESTSDYYKEDIKEYKAFIESAQQILDLCQSKSEYIIVTKQQADWLYDELEDVDGITYEEDDEKDVRKILSYLTRKDKSASEWNKKDKNR